jgi:hypothetical protein
MITHIIAVVILAVTYGAFWHNQPARPPNDQRRDPVFLPGKGVIPERQTGFFRQVLCALLVRNPWRRILADRAGMRPSIPACLFKPKANTNELAAGKTT